MAEATLYIRNSGLLRRRWLYHSLFWVLYYGLTITLYLSLRDSLRPTLYITTAVMILLQAAVVYLNLYLFIPHFLYPRKYGRYALALLTAMAICPLLFLCFEYSYDALVQKFLTPQMHLFSLGNWFVGLIQCIYVLGLATGLKFVKDTLINQQIQKEREKQYLETELKFLRTQIQPHFFFNTLNNIYSLTLKKSDQAPEIILKLSDLMSYMLYESTAPLVPLKKEIDYLHNYLDVEQLRFGNRLTISFNIEGDTTGIQIPPMILILFLENSFKHGVKNNISNILLTICLKVQEDYLLFHVENPISEEEKDPNAKGIGLSNVRRRLDLLYGHRHSLDIRETDGRFIVTLKMPLC